MRNQLLVGPLPQSEQIKYLLAATLFSWANIQSPFVYGKLHWNLALGGAHVAVIGFAIYYVYRCNGGGGGERFLERYVSLGWILMVRFFFLLTLPLLALRDVYFGSFQPGSGLAMTVHIGSIAVWQLLFYWILGTQMRAVARPAT